MLISVMVQRISSSEKKINEVFLFFLYTFGSFKCSADWHLWRKQHSCTNANSAITQYFAPYKWGRKKRTSNFVCHTSHCRETATSRFFLMLVETSNLQLPELTHWISCMCMWWIKDKIPNGPEVGIKTRIQLRYKNRN